MRAMWRARLELGSDDSGPERIGVKLYAAVRDRRTHFRLLHEVDDVPVRQKMVRAADGEPVDSQRLKKGYPLGDGRYVVLDDEELAALDPKPSRSIRVEQFIGRDAVDPSWFGRPYLLGPDGPAGRYAAVAAALEDEQALGLARWVMRGRRHAGVLQARDGRLVLVTLYLASEILPLDRVEAPRGRALEREELELAEQLVDALAGPFQHEAFFDEHRERLRALIEAKARGEPVARPAYRPPERERSLRDALQRSVAAANEKVA